MLENAECQNLTLIFLVSMKIKQIYHPVFPSAINVIPLKFHPILSYSYVEMCLLMIDDP